MNLKDDNSGGVTIAESPEYNKCADGTVVKGKCPEDADSQQTSGYAQEAPNLSGYHTASDKRKYAEEYAGRSAYSK